MRTWYFRELVNNIFTNNLMNNISRGFIVTDTTDRFSQVCNVTVNKQQLPHVTKTKRLLRNISSDRLLYGVSLFSCILSFLTFHILFILPGPAVNWASAVVVSMPTLSSVSLRSVLFCFFVCLFVCFFGEATKNSSCSTNKFMDNFV